MKDFLMPGDLRIMVVGDNSFARTHFQKRLNLVGLSSLGFDRPELALTAIELAQAMGAPYHLAFIANEMSGMDGITLASAIRCNPSLHETQTILLMSSSQASDEFWLRKAGIAGCLQTPVDSAQLMETVVAVCRNLRAAPQSAPTVMPICSTPSGSSL